MLVKTYVAGPVDANNYLVVDEQVKEAILIDCSDFVPEIVDYVEAKKQILSGEKGMIDYIKKYNTTPKSMITDVVLFFDNDWFKRLAPEIDAKELTRLLDIEAEKQFNQQINDQDSGLVA